MEIEFKNKKLANIFNSQDNLRKQYGAEQAKTIRIRMGVLSAARTLKEVPHTPPDRKHELSGQRKGQFAVDLKHPFRLVFEPNHEPIPLTPDGGIDLAKITSITIISVEDYHK